jgi:hypothetical protein
MIEEFGLIQKNLSAFLRGFLIKIVYIYEAQSSFWDSVLAGSVLLGDFSVDDVPASESDFDVVRLPDGERLSVA